MSMPFPPPTTPAAAVDDRLREHGHAVLAPDAVGELAAASAAELDALRPYWDRLAPDAHMKDGGRYRRRRHGCYVMSAHRIEAVPHRPHWQPVEYNALHGGMQRWFEPLEPEMTELPAWSKLLRALAVRADALHGKQPWFVEAHPFRIDTTDGIGRPTPEGAHRDGVDLVAVFLVARHHIKGGETRVFEADGPNGLRFTMEQPWTLLLLDDRRVIHESTPIQPTGDGAHRDTLVVTLRGGGFQGPAGKSSIT
jgi:hypothetical protein